MSWQKIGNIKPDAPPVNSLEIGQVKTVAFTENASASINGEAPNQTLDLNIPEGKPGNDGVDNFLKVGSVAALPAGSKPVVEIIGKAPEQVINFSFPDPKDGVSPKPTSLTVGKVTALKAGVTPTAKISGEAPSLTLDLGIPAGTDGVTPQPTSISVGMVTTLEAGKPATAQISGIAPALSLDLGIPKGDAGKNATPTLFEIFESKVATAGTKVAIKFTKAFTAPPIVQPSPIWNGAQMVIGQASEVTTTGCNVTVMQSRGTLLLTSGPFEVAAVGVTFRMFVIGN